MKKIVLSLEKQSVYDEVGKTTSYAGAKKSDDAGAYERIFTTDEDQLMLNRFWDESKTIVADSLKKVFFSENEFDGTYRLELEVSSAFDDSLLDSMQCSLFSFFVMNIVSKWYAFANNKDVESSTTSAVSMLEDIRRKAFYKKKPERPVYY